MGRRHALHLVLALGTLAAASLSASIRQEEDWDLARPDPRVSLHPAQLSDLATFGFGPSEISGGSMNSI